MAKEVDPAALRRLLEVQENDSAIARLNHRKVTLPEAARLAEVSDALAELEADLEIARKQLGEINRESDRLEGEMKILDQKIEREEKRLFSGAVSNPKELSALQAEIAMLKRKRGELEDALLEVMVQRDDAAATEERLEEERRSASSEVDSLREQVSTLTGDIERELAEHSSERERLVADIPDDLLALYDSLRHSKNGVGAAALRGDTCEGCHTTLPAREVERLRSEGGLQRCDNCRRILVVL